MEHYHRVEDGEEKLVTKDVWDQAAPEERPGTCAYDLGGMLASMKRAEEELGPEGQGLGPTSSGR